MGSVHIHCDATDIVSHNAYYSFDFLPQYLLTPPLFSILIFIPTFSPSIANQTFQSSVSIQHLQPATVSIQHVTFQRVSPVGLRAWTPNMECGASSLDPASSFIEDAYGGASPPPKKPAHVGCRSVLPHSSQALAEERACRISWIVFSMSFVCFVCILVDF